MVERFAIPQAKEKHDEERERKQPAAAAAASSSNEPQRNVIRIIATRDKRQARKLAEQEGEEPLEQQITVVRERDGKSMPYAAAVEEIQIFLQNHGAEATLDEVRRGVGIDLQQPGGLIEALRANPRIEAVGRATGEMLAYRPPYGVRNRGSLVHLLSRATPGNSQTPAGGGGQSEAVLRSELKADETYPGVDVDVDELLAQGRCVRVDVNDKKARDFVLFAAPPGRPVTEDLRALWRNTPVPIRGETQNYLIQHKLRTQEEIDARAARKAERERKAMDARDERNSKKPRNGKGRIRNWSNAHLGDADTLEAQFPNPGATE